MRGILKGWVMISLSLSSGWTASGEQRRGTGVDVGVSVGAGDGVTVGADVSVGVMLGSGGRGVGEMGSGAGLLEHETLKVSKKANKTEYPERARVFRFSSMPKAGLNFKRNFT